MPYSAVAQRAFETILQKLSDTIEEKAVASGSVGPMVDAYKHGYLMSFWSMELAALDENAQLEIYNAISSRIILVRKELRNKEIEATAREVKIA